MLKILNALRRFFLRMRLNELKTRYAEDAEIVEIWPTVLRPMYLREMARLQGSLDRLAGHDGQVSFVLTPKAK